jgi:lysophospholipase L1-like esterase
MQVRSYVSLGIMAIVAGLCVHIFVHSQSAYAASPVWQRDDATVQQSGTNSAPPLLCKGYVEPISVLGANTTIANGCVSEGPHMELATYYRWGFGAAVKFPTDSIMYPMIGACDEMDNCLYLPERDILIVKQYRVGSVPSLVLYVNASSRFHQMIDPWTLQIEYRFDTSNPSYIFEDSSGFAWPIKGWGVSNNGLWLAVEVYQRGIGLLNLDTLTMKRVSDMSFSYGHGFDPTTEFAVANDGKTISFMGANVGFSMMDITNTCGDYSSSWNIDISLTNPCQSGYIRTNTGLNAYVYGTDPRFDDAGGELDFYGIRYDGTVENVAILAPGYNNPRLDYLALGDSFSSGEGETDDSFYLQGTNDEYEKCHVSTRAYPFLIARVMGVDSKFMHSVACSGAKTSDIRGGESGYWGQGLRLGSGGFNMSNGNRVLAQSTALETFDPGRAKQISFVKKYQPKVITVGIGGNDVDFTGKLRTCVGPGTCEWANTSEGREKTAIEMRGLFSTLVATYTELHQESPSSKIYAVGYPQGISENGTCDPLTGTLLDTTERRFMYEGIDYIDTIIAAAAKAAGIKYLDIETAFGNHVLCGTASSDMNGLRVGDDSALVPILNDLKLIGNESFHPNPSGHIQDANAILASVPDLATYQYCSNGLVICPDNTITAPTPSSYWLANGVEHNYTRQETAEYIEPVSDVSSLNRTITLDDYDFQPNSDIKVEIHSDPIAVGTFTLNQDGGLKSTEIMLPKDLSQGYHAMHIYGTSYSGEKVDLYDIFPFGDDGSRDNQLQVGSSLPASNSVVNYSAVATHTLTTGDLTSGNAISQAGAVKGAAVTKPPITTHKGNSPICVIIFLGMGVAFLTVIIWVSENRLLRRG